MPDLLHNGICYEPRPESRRESFATAGIEWRFTQVPAQAITLDLSLSSVSLALPAQNETLMIAIGIRFGQTDRNRVDGMQTLGGGAKILCIG